MSYKNQSDLYLEDNISKYPAIDLLCKMGYKYIIIPSLSDAAKALPIDLSFYKRFKKVK